MRVNVTRRGAPTNKSKAVTGLSFHLTVPEKIFEIV